MAEDIGFAMILTPESNDLAGLNSNSLPDSKKEIPPCPFPHVIS
jgi:hypothetical protein